jgi:hypothetical protein
MLSKYRYTALLIFLSFCTVWGSNSGKLDQIEKQFKKGNTVISIQIGDSVLHNDFELFNKITGRTVIVHKNEVRLEGLNDPDPVNYYNVWFQSPVVLNEVVFVGPFDFTLARCKASVNFNNSKFKETALFNWTQFLDSAQFSRLRFEKPVHFIRAKFNGPVDFYQSLFKSRSEFDGITFNKEVNFSHSQFFQPVSFSYLQLNQNAAFYSVDFYASVFFNNSSIKGTLNFDKSRFDSIADFSNSVITGKILFGSARLPKYLNLSGINSIQNEIDLTETELNENYPLCRINLVNTDVSRIRLRYDNFRLWFPPNTSYEACCLVYDAVLNSFLKNGYLDSYKHLDIEFQQYKYAHTGETLRDFVNRHWWNYGYNKEYIFKWIFWFALSLTLINNLFLKQLMKNIYHIGFLNVASVEERMHMHHPVIAYFLNFPTAFLYTLVLLIGGAFGMSFRADQIKFPGFFGLIYIISISLIGISCSAFIINFIFHL